MSNKKRKFSIPSKYMLLVLTILCIGIIFITFTMDLTSGPLKAVSEYVFTPLQNGINQIGTFTAEKTDSFRNLQDVLEENEALKEEISRLSEENSSLALIKSQADELRELYDLDQSLPDYEKEAAAIIAKDAGNWFHSFVINKGSDDGLMKDMNVLAPSGGLVGIITEVGTNYAKVRGIIDDSSNVKAMISSTSDQCIVTGDLSLLDQGVIRVIQLIDSDDQVKEGDRVVTSHVSTKFLPDILIGYVQQVSTDANQLEKSGYITPAVDFETLKHVLVIKELKQTVD